MRQAAILISWLCALASPVVRAAEQPPALAEPDVGGHRLLAGTYGDVQLAVRFQPRLDVGALGDKTPDGNAYAAERDFYLRRIRLGLFGGLLGAFRYKVTIQGDRVSQIGHANEVKVTDAHLDWRLADALELRVGKSKLPLTRAGFTSSAFQLLVERPFFIEEARSFFNGSTPMNAAARGRFFGGAIAWYAALADGWNTGDKLYSSGPGNTVRGSDVAWAARLELSPPGWSERRRSDAHLGEGKHFTVAGSVGMQDGIRYADTVGEESRRLFGWDVSGHYGPLTAQAEWSWWEIDSTLPARGLVRPRGFYAQAAWYIAALHLEPAARYEDFREDTQRPGFRQQDVTLGLNAYLMKHALKLQASYLRRLFAQGDPLRLPLADSADVFQLQAQLFL